SYYRAYLIEDNVSKNVVRIPYGVFLWNNAEKLQNLCGNAKKLQKLWGSAEKLQNLRGNSENLQNLWSSAENLQNSWGNTKKFAKMVDKPPQKE
ncbi:MAG: hypothetical protein II368_03690, partial [Clostridia bacterium]|nr:hypothetical protein [Clostridia bacterium]